VKFSPLPLIANNSEGIRLSAVKPFHEGKRIVEAAIVDEVINSLLFISILS
jgi:hypothetical protein